MANQHVVVYTSDKCVQCKRVVEKLDDWGVDYEERNISADRSFIKELQENKIYGTPATFIGNYRVLGFQEYKLKKALGIRPEIISFSEQEA